MQIKYISCKNNLIHITCSHKGWLYYYCLKSGKKWFWINNCDGHFSTLLHIAHMTGGSLIWPMHNNQTPTLLHICTKTEVILWGRWIFPAHWKLIKLHTSWQCFPPAKNLLSPPPRIILPWRFPPTKFLISPTKSQFPLLNNNFHVITQ